MLLAAVCRWGNQDLRRVAGLDRPLTKRELILFRACCEALMDSEFQPLEPSAPSE